jgi:hypothetical protein|tara:strand:+ start:159 stop:716 length:558 start_codon:yes stop_codon:yes gene_type:complete
MNILIKYTKQAIILLIFVVITGCGIYKKVDARKVSPNVNDRVQKNIQEGRSFKLFDSDKPRGGDFQFASSNELWRASLDVIDFMPLSSVNYSGGIIITDWYTDNTSQNESIKISIRFLTNEIRSDSLDIKVFNKKCINSLLNCKITEQVSLVQELKKEILKKAALYKEQDQGKKKKRNKSRLYSQ